MAVEDLIDLLNVWDKMNDTDGKGGKKSKEQGWVFIDDIL